MITKVVKRDGRVVDFDRERIVNAVYKALMSVGKADRSVAESVADNVIKELNKKYDGTPPSVEDIQDTVEKVLIGLGYADVAKSYIIYRKEREKIREEKKKVLNKKNLDEVDKKFSLNALRVIASRYLARDMNRDIVESPKDMFTRVAVNTALPEILYDERIYDKDGSYKREVSINPEYEELYIGKYKINKYHFERFVAAYKELAEQGKMKVNFTELISMIKNHEFDTYEKNIEKYYELMVNQDVIPNTPALINSGRPLGMLSACFTLDVEDDLGSIMELAKNIAYIHKAGGGTGMNFSKLRPKGDILSTSGGYASGPVSFMRIIDVTTDVIKQGGVRRGANMGILEVWHPDIEEFVQLKLKEGVFENFNISVGTWGDFWKALFHGEKYPLINPRNKKVARYVQPEAIIDMISQSAWSCADPGVLFFDNINKRNVLEKARGEPTRVTNPCGEEPLYPYESCNLASINVSNCVINGEFDWEKFHSLVRYTARALDNMITMNKYPSPVIDKRTKETRRIGVGIMGLADALFKMKIRYNSKEGFEFMSKLAEHLTYYAYLESIEMAKKRGTFPIFKETAYMDGEMPIEGFYHRELWTLDWDKLVKEIQENGLRNAMVTTEAPTGSISMIADTTNGIEPIFALAYEKSVTVGDFIYVDEVLKSELERRGLYSEALIKEISDNYGSIQDLDLPDDLKEVFVTSMDIHWADHVVAQAILQRWVTDSISKTINMPNRATPNDIKQAYILAHELGCKGVTVYRDGSKSAQVLKIMSDKKKHKEVKISNYTQDIIEEVLKKNPLAKRFIKITGNGEEVIDDTINVVLSLNPEVYEPEGPSVVKQKISEEMIQRREEPPAGKDVCPICGAKLMFSEGCATCPNCGWTACTN